MTGKPTDGDQLALYDAVKPLIGYPPALDGQYPVRVELCLWRDHARTWLVGATDAIAILHTKDDHWHVTVWPDGDPRSQEYFYADTIDAALIAAVVWVGERKDQA